MRRLILATCILTLTALACNAIAPPEPDATSSPALTGAAEPTPSRPATESEQRCGDGVCDGPENAERCPEDCAAPTTEAQPASTTEAAPASTPPVYVTVAGHIEDVPIYTNCDAYPDFRQKLLLFAETIAPTGAAVNLQVEYEFLQGVSQCESDAMQAATDGQNVLDYLVSHYGYEIDPHQEGGWEEGADGDEQRPLHPADNYADVRFLGGQVTPSISENVGGLVWDDAEQFARLSQGEQGWIYPDFTWRPKILSLAVSGDHHLGDFSRDDLASGVWMPTGAGQDFWAHDPDGSLVYVGPGEHANWDADRPWQTTPEFVQTLADQLAQGLLDRDKMYTASIAVPQSVIFYPERHPELLALLDQLAPLIESGRAVYVTYTEAVDTWRSEYGARPNIFFREGVEPPSEGADSPSGEEAPLYLTTMTHMEASFQDDRNEDVFRIHVEQLRYGLNLANEYGAKLTVESEMPFARACDKWGLNAMQELLDAGHGVGTHCDVGFQHTPSSVEELAQLYRERKVLVDALVGPENNRGFSGGGSEQDWVLAAQQAGFVYKDGGVGMLYLSMPLENRPSPEWTDEYIRSEGFHDPAPVALEERIYPFMMKDAQDFAPDEDGVILFSPGSIGRLDAMVEGGPASCPQMNCPFTEEDADLLVEQIQEVDRIRDRSRIAKVNVYVPVKLFSEENEVVWRYFLEQMQALEQQGVVTWATQGEVYDAYVALEVSSQ